MSSDLIVPWSDVGSDHCCCESLCSEIDASQLQYGRVEITREQALDLSTFGMSAQWRGEIPATGGCPACVREFSVYSSNTEGVGPCDLSYAGISLGYCAYWDCLMWIGVGVSIRRDQSQGAWKFYLIVAEVSSVSKYMVGNITTGTVNLTVPQYGISAVLSQKEWQNVGGNQNMVVDLAVFTRAP